MCIRFLRIIVCFLALPFIVGPQISIAQDQQIMTPVSTDSVSSDSSAEEFVKRLRLFEYEAARGNLSLCAADKECLDHVMEIRHMLCAADVCNGIDKSKEPISCFPEAISKRSTNWALKINPYVCPLVKSPSHETRLAFLKITTDISEDALVAIGSSFLALKGSAESCENYIKNYVGAYGPRWKYQWYRAMSGCRILAGVSSRTQEEKDFFTWFGIVQGQGNCSGIINSEMRNACSAPGAASPVPIYDQ